MSPPNKILVTLVGRMCVLYDVLTEVTLKITVFLDLKLCSLVYHYQYFGGMCYLHLQGRRVTVCVKYVFLRVCHTLSKQLHWRKVMCFEWDLKYGDCGCHWMLLVTFWWWRNKLCHYLMMMHSQRCFNGQYFLPWIRGQQFPLEHW
jgi:hypothetical protein